MWGHVPPPLPHGVGATDHQHVLKYEDDVFCTCAYVFFAVGHVIARLPEEEPVSGVTSLDNYLYVLRDGKSSEQIEEYDIDSYQLLRRLTVPGVKYVSCIIACGHSRCVYISSVSGKCVHRVALPGAAAVTLWPVGDLPTGLSLTVTHSVLVACYNLRKIKEFSTDGQLLRELTLTEDLVNLRHAVQLSTGQFIASHSYGQPSFERVCLLDAEGRILRSFGGQQGFEIGHIFVAVDMNGFVYVADSWNDRVLVLSPTLTYVRKVVSFKQSILCALHLDDARRLLYVAIDRISLLAGRVLVVSI